MGRNSEDSLVSVPVATISCSISSSIVGVESEHLTSCEGVLDSTYAP